MPQVNRRTDLHHVAKGSRIRHALRILFVMLSITLVGCQRATPSQVEGDVLYLHLYSNRYEIGSMTPDLPPPPRPYQCIATIGWEASTKLYADLPNHYEPEIQFEGTAKLDGQVVAADVRMSVQDVGVALVHHAHQRYQLDTFYPFDAREFYFVFSQSSEPLSPQAIAPKSDHLPPR